MVILCCRVALQSIAGVFGPNVSEIRRAELIAAVETHAGSADALWS